MYKEKYPMLTYYNYNKLPFSKAFHIFLVGHHYEAPVVTLSVPSLKPSCMLTAPMILALVQI